MGTIGLSFGSPTGGQGIDVTSTVTQLVTQLQGTETPYKDQLTTYQKQDTVISSLGSLLSTLSNDVQSLTDVTGVLSGKQGSSSNNNAVALLSATTGAIAGSHSVTVQQLAQTSTFASSGISAADTLSGSLTLHIGTGTSQTVSVNPSDATLSGLAATINQAGIGVAASVISDASGSRLSLISQTSGSAGQITIDSNGLTDTTTGAALSLTAGQSGQDALLNIDGVPITSGSNTLTNAISGVTLQLLGTSAAPVQLQIDNDTGSVTSAVTTFVKDYNAVVSALSAQEGKDASGNAQPLFGSPLISSLQQTLSGALTAQAGTSLQSISQIGLSLNGDGTLSLNTDQLSSVLTSNFAGVQAFFQNSNGFGLALQKAVGGAGNTTSTGLLSQASQANSAAETTLNTSISTIEDRIATQKTTLTTQLNQANQTLQAIPLQLNLVNEIYSAITGFNQQKG
jgi:flagellar hook-associated protein 2